jgi:hypothetical protein
MTASRPSIPLALFRFHGPASEWLVKLRPRVSLHLHVNHTPKSAGNQANFVINFCQIVFDP